jgi:hypothetical protein
MHTKKKSVRRKNPLFPAPTEYNFYNYSKDKTMQERPMPNVIDPGEKVHISFRRRFEGDLRRHFVGTVIRAKGPLVRCDGYFFIFDDLEGAFVKKPEHRTLIFQLANAGYIVNVIPSDVDIDSLHFRKTRQNILVLTDDENFILDINEFGSTG